MASSARAATPGPTWSTLANGNNNGDPEGIAYDTAQNHLFVADGVNAEIYEYTTAGTLLGHFDVGAYGVGDPETVEYNPVGDTLFVLSNRQSGPIIVETTKSGALLQTIDVSAAADFKPAGLAYAPASNGTGVKRFYFADRGSTTTTIPGSSTGRSSSSPHLGRAAGEQRAVRQRRPRPDDLAAGERQPRRNGLGRRSAEPPGAVTTTWSKVSGPAPSPSETRMPSTRPPASPSRARTSSGS